MGQPCEFQVQKAAWHPQAAAAAPARRLSARARSVAGRGRGVTIARPPTTRHSEPVGDIGHAPMYCFS
jgi:hypothetical protein